MANHEALYGVPKSYLAALSDLYDCQNGPPLIDEQEDWFEAMSAAARLLGYEDIWANGGEKFQRLERMAASGHPDPVEELAKEQGLADARPDYQALATAVWETDEQLAEFQEYLRQVRAAPESLEAEDAL